MRLLKVLSYYFFIKHEFIRRHDLLKTSKIELHIKLLLYIYQHPRCEYSRMKKDLGIGYSTLRPAIEGYVKQKKVAKTRKAQIFLGGDQLEFSLTKEGVEFLYKLKETLNKKLKNNR